MPTVQHVHAQLVTAPRDRLKRDARDGLPLAQLVVQGGVMRQRRFVPIVVYNVLGLERGLVAHGRIHTALACERAKNQRLVAFLRNACDKLLGKVGLRRATAGKNQQA